MAAEGAVLEPDAYSCPDPEMRVALRVIAFRLTDIEKAHRENLTTQAAILTEARRSNGRIGELEIQQRVTEALLEERRTVRDQQFRGVNLRIALGVLLIAAINAGVALIK